MSYFINSTVLDSLRNCGWVAMAEEGVEATLNFSQDQPGITTKLWTNYPEQTNEL